MSSESAAPHPRDLAHELGRRANAVAALVTLRIRGDASLDDLAPPGDCPDRSALVRDLRWLASAGLLLRVAGAGTWDAIDPAATYQLSRPGQALADSLTALTRACERLESRHAAQPTPID